MPMEKTSKSYCRKCTYGIDHGGQTAVYCNYLELTEKHRDCEVGWCDKFQEKRRKRK